MGAWEDFLENIKKGGESAKKGWDFFWEMPSGERKPQNKLVAKWDYESGTFRIVYPGMTTEQTLSASGLLGYLQHHASGMQSTAEGVTGGTWPWPVEIETPLGGMWDALTAVNELSEGAPPSRPQWEAPTVPTPTVADAEPVSIDLADAEYVESIASDLGMEPMVIKKLMKQIFPLAENAVAEFRDTYGEMGPGAGYAAIQSVAETYLGAAPPEEGIAPGWTGGYPGVGMGGVGGEVAAGGGFDFPPSAFYDAISEVMSPLQGADELDFLARFAQPGQYYPSTFYSLISKSMMPMGMNMPGEFYGMMEGAMPSGIAPGTPAPDFSFLGGLGQAPMPELGAFLVSLLQSNPELGLALMEAAIGMQQEYAMPFLPLLMAGGGGGAPVGQGDFSSALLEEAVPPAAGEQQLRGAERQRASGALPRRGA